MQHRSDAPSNNNFVCYTEGLTASNAAVALGKRNNMLHVAQMARKMQTTYSKKQNEN